MSVAANPENSNKVRNDALTNAAVAVGMEFIEPDELSPIAVPIDDIVRHGDDIVRGAENLSSQIHHFATNKNKTYTPAFERIVKKFDLGLDEAWNKAPVPSHKGRHPNSYHDWVLEQMNDIASDLSTCKNNCAGRFIKNFKEKVIRPVIKNPEMLRKKYWEMME